MRNKVGKINVHDLSSDESSDSSEWSSTETKVSDDCICYGQCNCQLNVLSDQHKKTLELITQGMAQANDQATRDGYQKMLLDQIKLATKDQKEESKKTLTGLSPSMIPHFNRHEIIRQFQIQAPTFFFLIFCG